MPWSGSRKQFLVGWRISSITRDNEQTGRLRRWFCRCVAGVRNIKKRRDPLGSQTDGIPAGNARPLLEKEQDNE